MRYLPLPVPFSLPVLPPLPSFPPAHELEHYTAYHVLRRVAAKVPLWSLSPGEQLAFLFRSCQCAMPSPFSISLDGLVWTGTRERSGVFRPGTVLCPKCHASLSSI